MAQGKGTLEAAWGEVEKAQSLESAWADVEKAKPAAPEVRTARSAGAGAIQGFAKLPELFSRIQTYGPRKVGELFGMELPQPPTARQVQEAFLPVTEAERQSTAFQAGEIGGGLAQMAVLGPGGIPVVAAGFGGQTYMTSYDEAKANGASEFEAHKAGALQGGISALTVAATAGLATKLNVNSGGILVKLAKNAGLGVAAGQAEQTLSNAVTKYTAETDRETFTGLKGRAATDAAVGLLMTALFPHSKPSKRVQEATGKIVLEGPIADVQLGKKPTAPMNEIPVEPNPSEAPKSSIEPPTRTPFEQKTAELQATQAALSEIEARNRGKKAPLEDLQERLRLVQETQRLALESQEAAAQGRALPPETDPFMQYLGSEEGRDQLLGMLHEAGGEPGGVSPPDPITGERHRYPGASNSEWWQNRPGSMSKPELERLLTKLTSAPEGTVPELTDRQLLMLEHMAHHTYGSRLAGQQMHAQAMAWAAAESRKQIDAERAALGQEPVDEATSFDPSTWADFHDTVMADQTEAGTPEADSKVIADAVTIDAMSAAERGGEPPGQPRPPLPDEALPGPGDPHSPDAIDRWIGLRQQAEYVARAKGAGWKERLRASLKQSAVGRIAERRKPVEQHRIAQADEAIHTYIDTLGKLDEEFGRYRGSLKKEHIDILERAKNLTDEQRALAGEIVDANRVTSEAALDAGVITNVIENYVKRLWRGVPGETDTGSPKRGGKPRFLTFTTGALPRQYSSTLQGWARGDSLKIRGAIDASVWNEIVVNQVALDRDLMRTLKKQGITSDHPVEPNWKQVEHPNFKDWTPLAKIKLPEDANALAREMGIAIGEDIPLSEATKVYGWAREGKHSDVQGRNLRIVPDGQGGITILHKSSMWAPPDVAKDLNNILGKSAIAEYAEGKGLFPALVRNYYRLNNGVKTVVTIGTQDNQIMAALRNFGAAPGDDLSNLSPRKASQRGWQQIIDRGPEIRELIREGGLQLTPDPSIVPHLEADKGRLSKAFDDLKIVGPAKLFIENNYRDAVQFLYGKEIPAKKAHLALLERDRLIRVNKQRLIDGTMTMGAINRAASQLSNNVHSGQNWQRMRSNPLGRDIAQGLIFAPDWTYSTLRTATDAFRAGATGEAHRILWSRLASRYVIAWAAMNFASAFASDPSDPVKEFAKRRREAWKLGLREFLGWDVEPLLRRMGRGNQSRAYVNILATFGEPFEAVSDPVDYLNRKIAVGPRFGINAVTGENFRGETYTTFPEFSGMDDKGVYKTTHLPEYVAGMKKGGKLRGEFASYGSGADPGPISPTQYPSFLMDQAKSSLPIQVQAFTNVLSGQMDAYEATLRALGFRVIVPSKKRQERAGIKTEGGELNLEKLFPR